MLLKKIIIIFILMHSIGLCSQELSGEVFYNIKCLNSELVDKKNAFNIFVENLKPTIETLEYSLKFNKEESVFKVVKNLDTEEHYRTPAISYAGKGEYYYSKNKGFIRQTEIQGELFLISPDNAKIDWKITSDRKKIGKYNCLLATVIIATDNGKVKKNKKITAWFTPDINLPFGPKNYYGLPGLILELQEDNLLYYCSSITFKNQKIKYPSQGIKITQTELNAYIMKKAEDFFGVKN